MLVKLKICIATMVFIGVSSLTINADDSVSLSKLSCGYPLRLIDTQVNEEVATIEPVSTNLVGVSADDISVKTYDEKLAEQKWQEEVAYLESQGCNVPNWEDGCRSYFYSYMPYTAVTSKSSPQYKLLRSDSCYTSNGLRMVDNRYCIAVGTYYASHVGEKLDVVFDDGSILQCIVGEFKSDKNTNPTHQYHMSDGSVIEFIVDYSEFQGISSFPVQGKSITKVIKV